jgi:hypothetical protein
LSWISLPKHQKKETPKPKTNTSHHSPKELGENQLPPVQTGGNKISTAQKAERKAKSTAERREAGLPPPARQKIH